MNCKIKEIKYSISFDFRADEVMKNILRKIYKEY